MNLALAILALLVVALSINPTSVLERLESKEQVAQMQEAKHGNMVMKRLLDRDTSLQTAEVILSEAGSTLHQRHNVQ